VHDLRPEPGCTTDVFDRAALPVLTVTMFGEPSWLLWEIDAAAGTATNDRGHTVRISPFLGVIGMPPNEPGHHTRRATAPRRRPCRAGRRRGVRHRDRMFYDDSGDARHRH